MIEFKKGKKGNIKVVDGYGDTLGKIEPIAWSGDYMFFSKKAILDNADLYSILWKLEALNAPSNNS